MADQAAEGPGTDESSSAADTPKKELIDNAMADIDWAIADLRGYAPEAIANGHEPAYVDWLLRRFDKVRKEVADLLEQMPPEKLRGLASGKPLDVVAPDSSSDAAPRLGADDEADDEGVGDVRDHR